MWDRNAAVSLRSNTRMPTYSDLFNTVTSTPTGGAPPGSGNFMSFAKRGKKRSIDAFWSGAGRETATGLLAGDGCVDGTNDVEPPQT